MPIIYSTNQEIISIPKKQKRASRLHRRSNLKNLMITDRRLNELLILYQHRLADSQVFQAVLQGSNQQILKELRLLYDHGYIDRPFEQFVFFKKYNNGEGGQEIIYALSSKGAKVLREEFSITMPKTDYSRKNEELGNSAIFHDCALTKLWACLHTALEQKRFTLKQPYNLEQWYQDQVDRQHLKITLDLPNNKTTTIIPDACLKIQTPQTRHLFFVEFYRTRKGGHQTYLNRLKQYNLCYQQKKFARYRVKKGFKVITIVPSRAIAENLIKLINSKAENIVLRHYSFWFVSELDYCLYKKEKTSNPKVYTRTENFDSILQPIFRTPVDNDWHTLENG